MESRTSPGTITETPPTRWTDEFLDAMRGEGDPHADDAIRQLLHNGDAGATRKLFASMDSNDAVPPSTLFPSLAQFFTTTGALPPGVDLERIHRGEDVFRENTYGAAVVLLMKSLPEGYQAPNLSIILNISGELRNNTYRRLLGTLQTVVNVSTCRGFQTGGRAVITAQKLRLLHAGIRHITARYRPEYTGRYGVSVNQEDMLGTIMGFSLLVIEGWRTLHMGVTPQEEEDYLYLWITFARMMGVHPPGQPASTAYVPANVADATAFYRAYERRHYVDAAANPDGVALAQANVAMLRSIIPWPLRLLGFGMLPRLMMTELMQPGACARLDIAPVRGHVLLKWILLHLHWLLTVLTGRQKYEDFERVGMILFQRLISVSFGGEVTFAIPTDLDQLRAMVNRPDQARPAS